MRKWMDEKKFDPVTTDTYLEESNIKNLLGCFVRDIRDKKKKCSANLKPVYNNHVIYE